MLTGALAFGGFLIYPLKHRLVNEVLTLFCNFLEENNSKVHSMKAAHDVDRGLPCLLNKTRRAGFDELHRLSAAYLLMV